MEKALAKIPRVKQRREAVLNLLLSGWSRSQIITQIRSDWSCGIKTVDKDIEKCYQTVRLNHNTEYSELISRHIAMYYELFNKCEDLGDVKGGIQALQAVEKLLKMHQPDVAQFVQANTYNFDNLSLDEAKQLLLEAKEDD